MKTYQYEDQDGTHTFTEEEIIDKYYFYWYGKMCKKYGQPYVDKNYNEQDCLNDWITINFAYEVSE